MQYECDTSKAARGTGADLSIHRLESTVTQRPYTAVRTNPCSRDPFLTLRRPAKLPMPVYTSHVGVRAEPGALVYLPTPVDTKVAWCSAMVYADMMSIQFSRRASTRSRRLIESLLITVARAGSDGIIKSTSH